MKQFQESGKSANRCRKAEAAVSVCCGCGDYYGYYTRNIFVQR